ncbi:hypothetical protein HMPREF0044_0898 [Gleimia coleocanis DSM 15436]|uniref:Sortase family protein n=1 Tax=Gleimia coleocanis DSM 15436 TaxID=525245 RepID=C0W020_9ACTO|nr:class F sortase [Gleimia coleocanis]EEH63879.1 hypothetical protein HMPREF0044_0898 [Gleimia coleocanis DSM 15436]
MKKIVATVLTILLLIGATIFTLNYNGKPPQPSAALIKKLKAMPAASLVAPQKPAPPTFREKVTALGCDLTPQEFIDPVKVELVEAGKTLPLISVGLDETGLAPGVPPLSERQMFAWYNEGPKLGSAHGKVLLTGHTYADGVGIGNELLAGLVKPGDILKISNAAGENACYRYRENLHIVVAEYDEDSDAVYDDFGTPTVAMMVCDDWDPNTASYLARKVFYSDLLTNANVDKF